MIILAILSGMIAGVASRTAGGILGGALKQTNKIWRIQAGRGFDSSPNKQYGLYKSLLSSNIQRG
ncbi:vacuolating cytotoxin vacA fragment 1 [Helicobacter acinonychis str. Sheeba]|uniref:Vacuolating cytotoxin 1 n=2 Tax=Helicobacter acinonychis TaxID=212 RepID=Q17WH2_HELAH|nr:vacuolating cytotoxin fragment 1 [Helicobacter acinonychis str. Sheeba]CAK00004.1 vacuolating cytotoxin vacA fragment 1 [Helicobacter acinonychis str. Sheeba]